jgi:serine/threonine-protein kinase
MAPVPALAGTVPPSRDSKALDREIASIQARARRKRLATFGAIAAVVVAGYYVREKLSPSSATEAAANAASTASLHATGKHEGIKLVLDGREVGELPQQIKGLTPGEHAVVFEAGDRYAPQKSMVTIGPNETKELEFVSLKVTKGAATFDVKTPGTTLTLVSSDERRALTDYTHPIDIDNSKTWTLEATKPGFKALTMPVTFDDVAEKTFVVTLTEPAKVDVPAAQDTDSDDAKTGQLAAKADTSGGAKQAGPTQTAGAPAKAPAATPAAAAPVAAAPATKAAAGNCTININSIPSSKIILDGRPIGLTPKMGVSVPAGPHGVMLISDNGRKAANATCKPGETRTIAVRISQ